jgi:hypothetical protein
MEVSCVDGIERLISGKKVGSEPFSQTSAVVRVSNRKFRLQLQKLKLES